MNESELQINISVLHDAMSEAVEQIAEMIRRIMCAFKKAFEPVMKWLRSPQTRMWMKDAIVVMRRAGVIQPRRKKISTKRAMIYQRKMGIVV